jgi:hypothetical protein
MLYWALMFLIIAIVAGFFGFWRHCLRCSRHRKNTILHLPNCLCRDAAVWSARQKKPTDLVFNPNTRSTHRHGLDPAMRFPSLGDDPLGNVRGFMGVLLHQKSPLLTLRRNAWGG